MFTLRALCRACRKRSFLFNPLAARPVQHGGDKGRVCLPFGQDVFPPWCCAGSWLIQERQVGGRRPAPSSDAAACVSLVSTNTDTDAIKGCYLFVCLCLASGWEPTSMRTSGAEGSTRAELYSPVQCHVTTQICPIPHTQDA